MNGAAGAMISDTGRLPSHVQQQRECRLFEKLHLATSQVPNPQANNKRGPSPCSRRGGRVCFFFARRIYYKKLVPSCLLPNEVGARLLQSRDFQRPE